MTKRRQKKNTITSKSVFPEDLIVEVLRILEAKSVARFRCVSKSWNSIISDPSFARLHLKRSRLLLLYDDKDRHQQLFRTVDYQAIKKRTSIETFARPSFRIQLLTTNLRVWGSCNGIICFGHFLKYDVSLWNPTTGEVYNLPKPLPHRLGCLSEFGFGWDKSANDYKVVRVLSFKHPSVRTEVEVLALKSKTWVKREPGIDWNYKIIYYNGGLHWLASSYGAGNDVVARFDLADEKLHKLYLPLGWDPYKTHSIGVLGDYFCFCSKAASSRNVWVMKEYGVESSWTKLTTIIDRTYVPLWLTTDGGIIGIANRSFMVKSNTNSGPSAKLMEQRCDIAGLFNKQCYEAVVYEETLVSLVALANTP